MALTLDIAPLDSTLDEAHRSYKAWRRAVGMMPSWEELSTPLQSTVGGVAFRSDTSADPCSLLPEYYRRRHHAEQLISRLDHAFFTTMDDADDLTYDLIRLLAWWTRCLSDEIDLLGGGSHDPYDPPLTRDDAPCPPAFTDSDLTKDGVHRICETAAVLRGLGAGSVYDLERTVWTAVDRAASMNVIMGDGRDVSRDASRESGSWRTRTSVLIDALRDVLTCPPVDGSVIGIDLETTGLKPTRTWVVDAGWLQMDLTDPTEREIHPMRRSYGVPSTRMTLGNPTQNLTGISADDLAGLKPLDLDPDAQNEILNALLGRRFVAHNASFENTFFKLTVDGYAEALRNRLIKIVDSRNISRWLDPYPGKKGNHLEEYARHWNALDPATDSERHLGLEDSEIMLKAMGRHLRSIWNG